MPTGKPFYKISFEEELGQSLIIPWLLVGIVGTTALLGLSSFAKLVLGLGFFAGGGGLSILSGVLTLYSRTYACTSL